MVTRQEASMGRRKIKPEQEGSLVEAYKSGSSLKTLAKIHSCSVKAVRDSLNRLGARFRNRGGVPKYTSDEFKSRIFELWDNDKNISGSAIARSIQAPPSIVIKILNANGRFSRPQMSGSQHPSWKGGRHVRDGYAFVMVAHDHKFAIMRNSIGYVPEHRLVVAEHVGRPLLSTETVHHINGNCLDNRIDNLQLRKGKHGNHACFRCGDCGSINILSVPLAGG